jgi:hypothetical protein
MPESRSDIALSLLVDAASLADDPQLPFLLSFNGHGGTRIEQNVRIVREDGQASYAVVGVEGNRRVSLSPLNQYRRFAADIAARPGCQAGADVIERGLAFSYLADILKAEAVVSPIRRSISVQDAGLLRVPVFTVAESLAVVGALVRQQVEVPLGGDPSMTQQRTEVYPLTARVILIGGQEWWSSCAYFQGPLREDVLNLGGAVYKRLGQALRGRDGVHEALRCGEGRAAILDSLYHLDVVLTSGVAALDALARLAHKVFEVGGSSFTAKWQGKEWVAKLRQKAPSLSDVIGGTVEGQLQVITNTRNSIHAVPLEEFLSVERSANFSRVEHRAMLSDDLAELLFTRGREAGNPEEYGLSNAQPGPTSLNVGQFTERVLEWSFAIVLCTPIRRGTLGRVV